MRMFNREMIKEFALGLNYGPEPDTISYLIKNGARIAEVQVTMEERIAGVKLSDSGECGEIYDADAAVHPADPEFPETVIRRKNECR